MMTHRKFVAAVLAEKVRVAVRLHVEPAVKPGAAHAALKVVGGHVRVAVGARGKLARAALRPHEARMPVLQRRVLLQRRRRLKLHPRPMIR